MVRISNRVPSSTSNQTTALSNIVGLKVLNTTISIFNVLTIQGQIDRNSGLGKDSFHTRQRLEDSLIGKGRPNFSSSDIDTLDTRSFRSTKQKIKKGDRLYVSIGPLKSNRVLSTVSFASGVIPVE
jgi:hypothetical protein